MEITVSHALPGYVDLHRAQEITRSLSNLGAVLRVEVRPDGAGRRVSITFKAEATQDYMFQTGVLLGMQVATST